MAVTPAISRRSLALGAAALTGSIVVPSLSVSANLAAQTPHAEDARVEPFESLVEWLNDRIEDLGVPGAAVGIVHGDQRLARGIGIANVESGTPFSPDTPFGIASLSKIYTATALSALAHHEALDLDDPVTLHLPGFRLADESATAATTVGHLVSHAGGWADLLEPEPGEDSFAGYAPLMADLPQVTPPGAHFSYSNSGFMLAGGAMEHAAGTSFEELLADLVFRPLGLRQTGSIAGATLSPDRALGHQEVDGALVTIPTPEISRVITPAAGLSSTLEDMLTFVAAHAGIDPGQLDPGAQAAMRQPRNGGGSVGPIVVNGIGTGWMLLDIDGETVLMSQAGDSGLISAMIAVPSHAFGMVVFANADASMMLVNDTVLRGLDAFTGLALAEPSRYSLSRDEAVAAEGTYGYPEWLEFTVTATDGAIDLTVSAGGETIPDLSGAFTMVSATSGYRPHLGSRLWLDLVPDDTGAIQWLRFAARMVPRQG